MLVRRCTCVQIVLSGLALPSFGQQHNGNESSTTDSDAIINPFHREARWRLWTRDQTPVTYNGSKDWRKPDDKSMGGSFAPPASADRLYPTFASPAEDGALPVLKHFSEQPAVAGFWDDCYVTLDFSHTRIPLAWSASGASINLKGQFVNVHFGMADTAIRMSLGTNFTSQSFARRGRHIVDDTATNEQTERDFFFANCVRATPAHISYTERDPERAHDAYDALFGHSYHSVGQSGSETRALTKMLIAGGCMPRATKDLLKRHGAYAIALLTVFKAALPYSDADGKELPYENELRHRPAYSSDGAVGHIHYCPANPHYHGYDDARHMQRMIGMARGMDVAPPVAVLKLVDINVQKGGNTIVERAETDSRVLSVNKTIIRIWGQPGETIAARIDVRESYDLQGQPLSYAWHQVYPSQRNVRVQKDDEPGVWRVTVAHEPKLPKGRIPVMMVARNGSAIPSNPVFVNFFWPDPGDLSDWRHTDPKRGKPKVRDQGTVSKVTRNKRPVADLGLRGDTVWTGQGSTVRFPLRASDPEGHPITIYRRSGEVGAIRDGEFVLDVPDDDPGKAHAAHFIFSDGTGGYTGTRVKVLVNPNPPVLPQGWLATTIGIPSLTGTVEFNKGVVRLGGAKGWGPTDGMFVYRDAAGDVDLVCRVDDFPIDASRPSSHRISLMMREHLHERARHAAVQAVRGAAKGGGVTAQFRCQTQWRRWAGTTDSSRKEYGVAPVYLRLVRRGAWLAGYVASKGQRWEQIGSTSVRLAENVLVGLALTGRRGTNADRPPEATCTWLGPQKQALPMIQVSGKKPRGKDGYTAPVGISLSAGDESAVIVYTLDGQDPNARSTRWTDPITISEPGDHELRSRVLRDGQPGDVVVHTVRVLGPVQS